MSKIWFEKHHDDEYIDQIHIASADLNLVEIKIVPRYKTSDMSGDEWRIGCHLTFLVGGAVLFEQGLGRLESAMYGLPHFFIDKGASLEGGATTGFSPTKLLVYRKGFKLYEETFPAMTYAIMSTPWRIKTAFETDVAWKRMPDDLDHSLCFQPGCKEKASSTYQLKKLYYHNSRDFRVATGTDFDPPRQVRFCPVHLKRGDCGLEDNDDNYEVISGPGPTEAKGYGKFISESM